jgi:hypothetical protein
MTHNLLERQPKQPLTTHQNSLFAGVNDYE